MKKSWFGLLFTWRGSVIPAILPKVIISIIFAIIISTLYKLNIPVSLPILSSVVPSIVLGLLLVFRTNTAYERFWEGRKLWGIINNSVRNLSRMIWVSVKEENQEDRQQKIKALHLLLAFALSTKLHLRSESINEELAQLLPQNHLEKIKTVNSIPLEIAFLISDYLQYQQDQNKLNPYQSVAMFNQLNSLVEAVGGCERILRTPIPLAYAIHLKQLILLYCFSLPFQMVKDLGFLTAIIVGIISFTVFGIEEIGIEIENPFGYDANDLPLDQICQNMEKNLDDLITLSPSIQNW